jgi:magnesium transporter
VTVRDWWRVASRELATGLTLGLILAVIGFARIELWQAISAHHWTFWGIEIGHNYDLVTKDGQTITIVGQHLQLAWTVALSLVGVVLFGTLVGSMLPFVFRRLGFDPASASAPFIATFVDVTGLIIYFNVALHVLLR